MRIQHLGDLRGRNALDRYGYRLAPDQKTNKIWCDLRRLSIVWDKRTSGDLSGNDMVIFYQLTKRRNTNMGKIMDQFRTLASVGIEDDKIAIEDVIKSAAAYVQIVTEMEMFAGNIMGRSGDEYKSVVSEADAKRSNIHNGLIGNVNMLNRICDLYSLPHIYTGDEERRHYGDFAFELVKEIFEERK